jgi:hypothetical protein
MKITGVEINLADALRIKSAEYWLQLGQPTQALSELQRLSRKARPHPWVNKVLGAAFYDRR